MKKKGDDTFEIDVRIGDILDSRNPKCYTGISHRVQHGSNIRYI